MRDVSSYTRSITPCKIEGIIKKGEYENDSLVGALKTNCDLINQSSGGPLICKYQNKWQLAGTVNSSGCDYTNDPSLYDKCFNPRRAGTYSADSIAIPISTKTKNQINNLY